MNVEGFKKLAEELQAMTISEFIACSEESPNVYLFIQNGELTFQKMAEEESDICVPVRTDLLCEVVLQLPEGDVKVALMELVVKS